MHTSVKPCNWLLLTGNEGLLAVFVLIQWITVAHKPAWGQNLSPLDRYTTEKRLGGREEAGKVTFQSEMEQKIATT